MLRACLLLLLAAPAAAAAPQWALPTLSTGLAAHRAQDYAFAARAFRRLAGEGSAIAETMLGIMYARGQGVARDPATAATWWLRAANRGYPPAQLALARAYVEAAGVTGDRRTAWVWARLAASHGDAGVAAPAAQLARHLGSGLDPATLADLEARRLQWRPWATRPD